MSQENVDVVVTAVDAVNRADVEAFVACFHPDVEWVVSGERFPGFGGTYRGHEGVRRWLEQALEPWASLHLDIEEITEPSQDRVVVGVLMITRGGGSGVETRLRYSRGPTAWRAASRVQYGPVSLCDLTVGEEEHLPN